MNRILERIDCETDVSDPRILTTKNSVYKYTVDLDTPDQVITSSVTNSSTVDFIEECSNSTGNNGLVTVHKNGAINNLFTSGYNKTIRPSGSSSNCGHLNVANNRVVSLGYELQSSLDGITWVSDDVEFNFVSSDSRRSSVYESSSTYVIGAYFTFTITNNGMYDFSASRYNWLRFGARRVGFKSDYLEYFGLTQETAVIAYGAVYLANLVIPSTSVSGYYPYDRTDGLLLTPGLDVRDFAICSRFQKDYMCPFGVIVGVNFAKYVRLVTGGNSYAQYIYHPTSTTVAETFVDIPIPIDTTINGIVNLTYRQKSPTELSNNFEQLVVLFGTNGLIKVARFLDQVNEVMTFTTLDLGLVTTNFTSFEVLDYGETLSYSYNLGMKCILYGDDGKKVTIDGSKFYYTGVYETLVEDVVPNLTARCLAPEPEKGVYQLFGLEGYSYSTYDDPNLLPPSVAWYGDNLGNVFSKVNGSIELITTVPGNKAIADIYYVKYSYKRNISDGLDYCYKTITTKSGDLSYFSTGAYYNITKELSEFLYVVNDYGQTSVYNFETCNWSISSRLVNNIVMADSIKYLNSLYYIKDSTTSNLYSASNGKDWSYIDTNNLSLSKSIEFAFSKYYVLTDTYAGFVCYYVGNDLNSLTLITTDVAGSACELNYLSSGILILTYAIPVSTHSELRSIMTTDGTNWVEAPLVVNTSKSLAIAIADTVNNIPENHTILPSHSMINGVLYSSTGTFNTTDLVTMNSLTWVNPEFYQVVVLGTNLIRSNTQSNFFYSSNYGTSWIETNCHSLKELKPDILYGNAEILESKKEQYALVLSSTGILYKVLPEYYFKLNLNNVVALTNGLSKNAHNNDIFTWLVCTSNSVYKFFTEPTFTLVSTFPETIKNIRFLNNIFLACCSNGKIYSITKSYVITEIDLNTTSDIIDVAYNALCDKFIAISSTGRLYVAYGNTTFSYFPTELTFEPNSIIPYQEGFIIACKSGKLVATRNSSNWFYLGLDDLRSIKKISCKLYKTATYVHLSIDSFRDFRNVVAPGDLIASLYQYRVTGYTADYSGFYITDALGETGTITNSADFQGINKILDWRDVFKKPSLEFYTSNTCLPNQKLLNSYIYPMSNKPNYWRLDQNSTAPFTLQTDTIIDTLYIPVEEFQVSNLSKLILACNFRTNLHFNSSLVDSVPTEILLPSNLYTINTTNNTITFEPEYLQYVKNIYPLYENLTQMPNGASTINVQPIHELGYLNIFAILIPSNNLDVMLYGEEFTPVTTDTTIWVKKTDTNVIYDNNVITNYNTTAMHQNIGNIYTSTYQIIDIDNPSDPNSLRVTGIIDFEPKANLTARIERGSTTIDDIVNGVYTFNKTMQTLDTYYQDDEKFSDISGVGILFNNKIVQNSLNEKLSLFGVLSYWADIGLKPGSSAVTLPYALPNLANILERSSLYARIYNFGKYELRKISSINNDFLTLSLDTPLPNILDSSSFTIFSGIMSDVINCIMAEPTIPELNMPILVLNGDNSYSMTSSYGWRELDVYINDTRVRQNTSYPITNCIWVNDSNQEIQLINYNNKTYIKYDENITTTNMNIKSLSYRNGDRYDSNTTETYKQLGVVYYNGTLEFSLDGVTWNSQLDLPPILDSTPVPVKVRTKRLMYKTFIRPYNNIRISGIEYKA